MKTRTHGAQGGNQTRGHAGCESTCVTHPAQPPQRMGRGSWGSCQGWGTGFFFRVKNVLELEEMVAQLRTH